MIIQDLTLISSSPRLLASMVIFPLKSRLAQLAAALRRQYRLKIPDSKAALSRFV